MSAQSDQQGASFDFLDKELATRVRQLASQSIITSNDYDSFLRAYRNLEMYASMYSSNSYVQKQWAMERPIYDSWANKLQAKIHSTPGTQTLLPQKPTYTPQLYTSFFSGIGAVKNGNFPCGSCNGASNGSPNTKLEPIASRTPTQLALTSNYPAGYIPDVGDLLKRLLTAPPPATVDKIVPPLIESREIASGVITALVVGIIVYVIHRWRKWAL